MTKKELKLKVKEDQKILAQEIRDSRPDNWTSSHQYRHKHIVYCMLFNNTKYEIIERPAENNSPNSNYLDTIKSDWEGQVNEVIRNNT